MYEAAGYFEAIHDADGMGRKRAARLTAAENVQPRSTSTKEVKVDTHVCDVCEEKFQTRAELAMHRQNEHSHQSSDEVIAGQPPKNEQQ